MPDNKYNRTKQTFKKVTDTFLYGQRRHLRGGNIQTNEMDEERRVHEQRGEQNPKGGAHGRIPGGNELSLLQNSNQ